MDTPIITIGREYGAGGHTVARIIAQRLGIPAYDKEIIKLTAEESGLTPMQVLLAFVLAQKNTIAIPRTGSADHALLNAETADHALTPEQLERLNKAFPAPRRREPLDIQ